MPDEYARADALCAAFMAMRPDLPALSLDEWLVEHRGVLTPLEIIAGEAILKLHPDYRDEGE